MCIHIVLVFLKAWDFSVALPNFHLKPPLFAAMYVPFLDSMPCWRNAYRGRIFGALQIFKSQRQIKIWSAPNFDESWRFSISFEHCIKNILRIAWRFGVFFVFLQPTKSSPQ
jgi:hypothetical protein